MQPVFFGEALVGPKLPRLTYMLAYPDMAGHDKAWSAFGADPDWQKLRVQPGYSDAEIGVRSNIFDVTTLSRIPLIRKFPDPALGRSPPAEKMQLWNVDISPDAL